MPFQSNDPRSPFDVACPHRGCNAVEGERCIEGGVLLRHTAHKSRWILAQSSADDLDPLDFQATITTRTIVGSAAPGDLSVLFDDDDPQHGRRE